MKRKQPKILLLLLVFALAGCNFPLLAESEPQEIDILGTTVAQTIQAMSSQPQATQPPAEQPTAKPGQPTQAPQPTAPAGPQPTSSVNPCNKAVFLSETIPDDTEFTPGKSFTKSWVFQNDGTCTWNNNYKLAFSTGQEMGDTKFVYIPLNVAPGTQVKIDVPLTAPDVPGTYTGYWELQTPEGESFFQVYLRIKVGSTSFAVTSVYTNLKNVSPAACPHTYAVDVSIVSNAAGNVKYQTETSDGAVSGVKTLVFDSDDTMIAEFDWGGLGVAGSSTNYWLKVNIVEPNNQVFGPYNFSVTCP